MLKRDANEGSAETAEAEEFRQPVADRPSEKPSAPGLFFALRSILLAKMASDGWGRLIWRGARAAVLYGPGHLLQRAREKFEPERVKAPGQDPGAMQQPCSVGGLLFVNATVPRPGLDLDSAMAASMLQTLQRCGFEKVVLWASQDYDSSSARALEASGVRCVDAQSFTSAPRLLAEELAGYSVVYLRGADVARSLVAALRQVAPGIAIVFDPIQLTPDSFSADVADPGDADATRLNGQTRAQELSLIDRCDATVIHCRDGLYSVRRARPEARLWYWPLVLDAPAVPPPRFDERVDILLIGNFGLGTGTGAMRAFFDDVLPRVRSRVPAVRVSVASAERDEGDEDFGDYDGVDFLGADLDLTSVVKRVRLCVAISPLPASGELQIATCAGAGVPCVATTTAAECLGLARGTEIMIADTAPALADAIIITYCDEAVWEGLSRRGRRYVHENLTPEAAVERSRTALSALVEGVPTMEQAYELRSWEDYQAHRARQQEEYHRRDVLEAELLPLGPDHSEREAFYTAGRCAVCGAAAGFYSSFMYAFPRWKDGLYMVNWREHMSCGGCHFSNRVRAILHVLQERVKPHGDSRIYVTERVTPLYTWLAKRFKHLTGSEYLGADLQPGHIGDRGIRHEDLMNLSFDDGSFDLVMSLDVLEHVPNPERALASVARCLAPGGVFLFSMPFSYDHPSDVVLAVLDESGEIHHLREPEYHGNPVDPEGGALCFRYFGWDLLARLRDAGFERPYALAYWSAGQGYLGSEQFLFVARKPCV